MKAYKKVAKKNLPGFTLLARVTPGLITIYHSQSIKQSANYQSVDTSYGVTVTVGDHPTVIRHTIKRLENIVEGFLTQKLAEQARLLGKLPDDRGEVEDSFAESDLPTPKLVKRMRTI